MKRHAWFSLVVVLGLVLGNASAASAAPRARVRGGAQITGNQKLLDRVLQPLLSGTAPRLKRAPRKASSLRPSATWTTPNLGISVTVFERGSRVYGKVGAGRRARWFTLPADEGNASPATAPLSAAARSR